MATSQPFTFLVLGLEKTPELQALADAGHTIIYASTFVAGGAEVRIDQVIGPNAWRLLPDQLKWVPLMLKEMRAAQPKVKKATRKKVSDGATTS